LQVRAQSRPLSIVRRDLPADYFGRLDKRIGEIGEE
jgi:hypothetical protein